MSNSITRNYRFPTTIRTVSQTGAQLSPDSEGVNVVLHYAEGEKAPRCAEVHSDDAEEYAEIGLSWEGTALTDYDGVFELPREVVAALEFEGLTVPPDMQDDDEDPHHDGNAGAIREIVEEDRLRGLTARLVHELWDFLTPSQRKAFIAKRTSGKRWEV